MSDWGGCDWGKKRNAAAPRKEAPYVILGRGLETAQPGRHYGFTPTLGRSKGQAVSKKKYRKNWEASSKNSFAIDPRTNLRFASIALTPGCGGITRDIGNAS